MNFVWSFRETWMHRTNPSGKLILCAGLFLLVLFTHNINVMINVAWLLLLWLYTSSGHPVRRLLLISLPFALLFVSSAMSMILFGKGETIWFQWGLVKISEESFYRGLHIGLKTVSMALVGMIFTLTTRPVRLFYSLMQQMRLPARFAYSFMAAMRLLPMVAAEFQTLEMAFKVRGVKHRRGLAGLYDRLRLYAVPLLAQSIRKAQRIAIAMEAKRFASSGQRTYYYPVGWSAADACLLLLIALLWTAAFYLGNAFPLFEVTDVRLNG